MLIGLLVAALVGVALLAAPGSPFQRDLRKGLDLQGGLEVVLEAQPPRGTQLTAADLDRSVDIMRNRVDKLGVSEPEIRKQGSNQIVIQLPAVHDVNQAASIIGQTAQLELYDLETSLVPPSIDASQNPVAFASLYNLLTRVQSGQTGLPTQYWLFNSRTKKLVPNTSPTETLAQLKRSPRVKALKPLKPAPAKAKRDTSSAAADAPKTTTATSKPTPAGLTTTPGFPTGYQVLTTPKNRVVVTCNAATAEVCPGLQTLPVPGVTYYYLFEHDLDADPPVPQMTGQMLKLKGTQQDFDPQSGLPIVTMQFTGAGNKRFHQITRDEAIRGRALDQAQHFAIVLDDEIRSWPQIDYNLYPDGIDPTGGGAQITGLASLGEAKNLALVLQTGALPVKFVTVERSDVSATLGQDSLRQARNAAIVGLILVVLFLLLIYRFLGVVAVLGLAVYAAFMYGAILLFGVTLTLPGFAGLDAHDRRRGRREHRHLRTHQGRGAVREDRARRDLRRLREGLPHDPRRERGHVHHGARAVRRCDCVGQGVRADAAARHRDLARDRRRRDARDARPARGLPLVRQPALHGRDGAGDPEVAADRRRRPAPPLVHPLARRDRPQHRRARREGAQPGDRLQGWRPGRLRDAEGDGDLDRPRPGRGDRARRRDRPGARPGHGRRPVQELPDPAEEARTRRAGAAHERRSRTACGADKLGVKNVSSSFSRQILRGAIIAIVVSFALIALFVTMRYQWRFAVPILRTLVNDVLITLGIYAISGREVSASTVAALLTILGYSIYDTIIVFDRVRENMRLMPRSSIARIANVSVWEVLRRSIFTSVITLLPIAALYIFGGATLQDFAFAIMVGIVIGAVGTIFIATPLLVTLMERDPEYARRKDVPEAETAIAALDRAEHAAAAAPSPATPIDSIEHVLESVTGHDVDGDGQVDSRREARAAAAAQKVEATWTSPVTATNPGTATSPRRTTSSADPSAATRSRTSGATRPSACWR